MHETFQLATGSRSEQYETILPQIEAIIGDESDLTANFANICAVLWEQFHWHWTGFYLVKDGELVVGPYQGPLACSRIAKGKGVCGTAWEKAETIIVPDVEKFPGHIACSALSRSEIVVPVFDGTRVIAVLDIDSSEYNSFDNTDKIYLEKIIALI